MKIQFNKYLAALVCVELHNAIYKRYAEYVMNGKVLNEQLVTLFDTMSDDYHALKLYVLTGALMLGMKDVSLLAHVDDILYEYCRQENKFPESLDESCVSSIRTSECFKYYVNYVAGALEFTAFRNAQQVYTQLSNEIDKHISAE